MKLACEVISPLEASRWDDLVADAPGSSIFHTSGWMRMLHAAYGYETYGFVFSVGNEVVALVPVMQVSGLFARKRGVSLPFTDHCAPLILRPELTGAVVELLVEQARRAGWRTVELRGGGPGFAGIPRASSWYRHTVDLSLGESSLMASFRESNLRNIRKAQKEGLETVVSRSWHSVQTFYRLHCITRKEHGLPPQPLSFFRQLHHHLIGRKQGLVILAFQDLQPIAGAIFLCQGEQGLYKYGASDRRYQHLRANNLVMWEGIRWHVEHGYRTFCFGRTEPENSGLRQFKTGWGADEQIIDYFKYDLIRDAFIVEDPLPKAWQTKIASMLPIPVLRAAGTILYKSAG